MIWFSGKLCVFQKRAFQRTKSNLTGQYRGCKGPSPQLCKHRQAQHPVPPRKHFQHTCYHSLALLCISNWSFCWVRDTRKEMDTWCFCCGIRALFFVFIGLIIIHIDLAEMEGEASKPLSDKADSSHSLRNPSCSCHHCTGSAGCQQILPW